VSGEKRIGTPTPDTQPYWDAARNHQLALPECLSCQRFYFYPRDHCPVCLGGDVRWRAVSGRGEDEIVEALDEALGRSLLTEIPGHGGPSYDFPYEALRRTVYDSASMARRRLLHGRAADVLIRRHEHDPATTLAATVAEHLQRAGRDADAAQWWWRAAAVARELYAHAEAHAHLVRALALGYPQLPGRIALGEVLVVLGRYREALAEFETAMRYMDQPVHAYLAQLAAIQNHDTTERLGDIGVPALVLAGEEDILIPVALSRRIHEGIPGSEWATTKGGHACVWEHPTEFNRTFLDFVRRHGKG